MPDFKMKVYDAVYELTRITRWASEEEYRNAEKLLTEIGATRVPPRDAVDKDADFYLANREQIEAFGSYRHFVVEARPRTEPPSLVMDFYVESAGGRGSITWANEDEYQQAKKFLTDMGAPAVRGLADRYESPEFFYLETAEQHKALREFQKSVEEKRKT
jgi:hypothetical protein